jgi:hypothetical protein
MNRKTAVLGINAAGQPDVWGAVVKVTRQQQEQGAHFEWAQNQAKDAGFSPRMAVDVADEMPPLLERLNLLHGKPFELDETEKGNIWLAHSEENWHNAWIRLGSGQRWLQVAIRPCNYPGLTVNTITSSDPQLAAHINREFGGGMWMARSCNLDGVKLEEGGLVLGDDQD